MVAIKVLLGISVLTTMLWAFRNRSRVGIRASARVAGVLLTAVAIASIINPDITQRAADLVGVTRGTDLVLYVLIVVFMATSLGMYFRFKELERRLGEVVRAQALQHVFSAPPVHLAQSAHAEVP